MARPVFWFVKLDCTRCIDCYCYLIAPFLGHHGLPLIVRQSHEIIFVCSHFSLKQAEENTFNTVNINLTSNTNLLDIRCTTLHPPGPGSTQHRSQSAGSYRRGTCSPSDTPLRIQYGRLAMGRRHCTCRWWRPCWGWTGPLRHHTSSLRRRPPCSLWRLHPGSSSLRDSLCIVGPGW